MLNLFIGVIVESIQTLREQGESADARAAQAVDGRRSLRRPFRPDALLAEIRALRAEVAAPAGGRTREG